METIVEVTGGDLLCRRYFSHTIDRLRFQEDWKMGLAEHAAIKYFKATDSFSLLWEFEGFTKADAHSEGVKMTEVIRQQASNIAEYRPIIRWENYD
jgi:hypothetical protein